MFVCLNKQSSQKQLYFAINKVLTLETNQQKIRGCYAIYKDNICLYVGQSSNISSRIATHLFGKYEKCDKILIFEDVDETLDLIPSEKYLIQLLKPIENILADFSEKICADDLISHFQDNYKRINISSSYEIIIDKYTLFICTNDAVENIYTGLNMREYIKMELLNGR